MALTVMNNGAAMMSLGELNKNISKAGKDLKKLSSGMKLNGAGDDASGYAISEKMRVRLRALVQDDQRRAQIDAIASGTTYNGKVLLDGRYGRKSVSGTETTVIAGTPGHPGTIGRSATPVDDSVIGLTSRVVHSGAVEPT